jgi:hypothetical protein
MTAHTTRNQKTLISTVHRKATQRIVAMTAPPNSQTANLYFHPLLSGGSSSID